MDLNCKKHREERMRGGARILGAPAPVTGVIPTSIPLSDCAFTIDLFRLLRSILAALFGF